MSILATLLSRRSIRAYTDETIPEETLHSILMAGLFAPTSRNLKPCRFTVVRNRDILEKLSSVKAGGSAFLKDANAAIVVSADADKSDTWIEDCSIALTCMHLAAAEAGIGSCWVQIHLRKDRAERFAEDNVSRILGLAEEIRTVGILALGIPAGKIEPHTEEEADFRKVEFVD